MSKEMSVQERKQREVELRKRIFAGGNEIGVESVRAMCRLHIDRIKERLLRESPATVPPLQGEALAYATVLLWIEEPLREVQPTGHE